MKLYFIYFFFFLIVVSCSSKDATNTYNDLKEKSINEILQELAYKNFNGKGYSHFNENGNYVLVASKEQTKNKPNSTLKFFIYDVQAKRIIFKDTIFNGNVFWKNSKTVEVAIYPAIEMKNPSQYAIGYLFNVETGEKTSRIKD